MTSIVFVLKAAVNVGVGVGVGVGVAFYFLLLTSAQSNSFRVTSITDVPSGD